MIISVQLKTFEVEKDLGIYVDSNLNFKTHFYISGNSKGKEAPRHDPEIFWSPGPDSRNDPLGIGSDTILWSWSADRIPQTSITIGSWDRENMKPNSLLPIESWHKSFTGKFIIEITWSWLNEKRQTDDIYSWRHNWRCGDVIYECRYESVMASSVHAHSVCSRYNTVWTCHIWQVCVCD